jgi:hypothetical protein
MNICIRISSQRKIVAVMSLIENFHYLGSTSYHVLFRLCVCVCLIFVRCARACFVIGFCALK